MKINLGLMIGAIAVLTAASCVSSKKYKSLEADNSALQGRLNGVSQENETCKNNLGAANIQIANLQDQLRSERSHLQSLQASLDKCLNSTSQGNVNIPNEVE